MRVFTDLTIANFGFLLEPIFVDNNKNPIDISGATTLHVVLVDPKGNYITKSGQFATDGKDGKIFYSVEQNVLIVPGTWLFYGLAKSTSFSKDTAKQPLEVEYSGVV